MGDRPPYGVPRRRALRGNEGRSRHNSMARVPGPRAFVRLPLSCRWMKKLTSRGTGPARGALTVGGFLALWLEDPDLAGRLFLTEGRPIALSLFRRWRLAVDEAEDAVQDGLLRAYAHDEAALRRADPLPLGSTASSATSHGRPFGSR